MSFDDLFREFEDEIEHVYDPKTKTLYWGLKERTPDRREYIQVEGGEYRVDSFYSPSKTVINVKQTVTTEKDLEYFKRQQAAIHPFHRENPEDAEYLAEVFGKA